MLRVVMTNIPSIESMPEREKDYLRRVWNINQVGRPHMLGRILQRGDWIIIYTEIVGNECQYSAEILSKLEIAVRGIKKNLEYLQYISKLTGASSIEMDESEFAQFNSDLSDY